MWIDDEGWLDQAVRVPTPHCGGTEMTPVIVVNHWTAGFSAASSLRALEVQGLSAHFVVDRDGGVYQAVPCTRRAFHAGTSSWRGRDGCNGFSVGIEWANLGPVERGSDGRCTAYGEPVPGRCFEHNGRWWEALTDAQIAVGHKLHQALAARFPSIVEAVDHATVAPSRKIDMIPHQAQVADWGRAFAGREQAPATPRPATKEREPLHVRAIQEALNRAGYHLVVDGIIGSKTLAAIIDFQRRHRLLPVGVVNDETRAALGL